ncbi:hypothetical protein AAVH_35452 [Aphelenchoides avenae]|nr:hypothetical protein AAVH_35452 [Aphelenchus avenae]
MPQFSRYELCTFQKLDIEPQDTPPGASDHNETVSDEVRKLKQKLTAVKAERDEALRKLHKLEEDHGGCEAFKQAMQAGTQMSIANALQIADDKCTEASRARDEAQRLLEVERKQNEDLQAAADEAIRLTFDLQIWRYRRLAKENRMKNKGPSPKRESDEVAKKGVKRKSHPEDDKAASPPVKRPPHPTPISDGATSVSESDSLPLKLQLFMKANLRGKVTDDELTAFIKLRGSGE